MPGQIPIAKSSIPGRAACIALLAAALAMLNYPCPVHAQSAPPVRQTGGAPASKGTKPVSLIDPAFQMEAYSYQIPAGWIFDGAVVPGPSCNPVPMVIYRAMSPDGITQMKVLPTMTWAWGRQQLAYAPAPSKDCTEWDHELSAADFLKYMIGLLHVTFVREEPIPAQVRSMFEENSKKQNRAFAAQTPPGQPVFKVTRFEPATAIVRYNINSIPVEERLSVTVTCNDSPQALMPSGWGHVHLCNGNVTRERARQGNLEAMKPVFVAIDGSTVRNRQWMQKWTAAVQAAGAAVRQWGKEQQAVLQRQHVQQMQAQEMRNRQHQEMMDVTRRGTDMAMARAQEATNARSRAADDWADYALDQQKRQDPRTGEVTKDSSAYSYTWVNESGQRYQTNDINDNPNGRLSGNWTLQQNVR